MKSKTILFTLLFTALIGTQPVYSQMFSQITQGTIITTNVTTSGCSWSDFNNDGWPDLYVANAVANDQLFQNNGDGTFTEVSGGAFTNNGGISSAAIWGDYDNDGHLDIFVSNNAPATSNPALNFLYKNSGPPSYTFSEVSNDATQTDANYTWSSSWVDYDNDGDLDLHMPENKHLRRDFFYENNGDGSFSAITPSFVTNVVESTGTTSWIDYDHDGDQDLFMIKSGRTHPSGGENNRIYHNNLAETGNLDFTRVWTAEMVNHFDLDFQASWADYDNDGDMDVFLGNFDAHDYLYRNEGDSLFTRITSGPLVTGNTFTLGSTWGDFDNDGDLDIYVTRSQGQGARFYRNDGSGNFTVLSSAIVGPPTANVSSPQSCSNADYNNDGYLDIFVANSLVQNVVPGNNYLYQNNGGSNHYFQLRCKGTVSNTSAIGAKVWAKASINGNPGWQLRHITGSPTGDRAQNDLRVHFGLGDANLIDSLIIQWPSGMEEVYTNVEVDQICEAVEGEGASCMILSGVSSLKNDAPEIIIAPNPATGNFVQIKYPSFDSGDVDITLYDLNGRMIRTYQAGNFERYDMNVSGIPAGMYVVKVSVDTEVFSAMLEIQKD